MAKEFISEGAVCICKFGAAPAIIEIKDQKHSKLNGGKLCATTKTLNGAFGPAGFVICNASYPPRKCSPQPTMWSGFFKGLKIGLDAYPLTNESKCTCAAGGKDCIEFTNSGQIPVPGASFVNKTVAKQQNELHCTGSPLTEAPRIELKLDVRESKPQITSPYLFFLADGTYLAGEESNTSKVYITDEVFDPDTLKPDSAWEQIKKNARELAYDYQNLKELAAIANGEAWQAQPENMQKEELFAIASAIFNAIDKKIERVSGPTNLRSGFSYARKDKVGAYTIVLTQTGTERNEDIRTRNSLAAAINAVSGDTDYSNGAYRWDGIDVLQKPDHYRYRPHSANKKIVGVYDPRNYREAFYNNAMTYGTGKNKITRLKVVPEKVTLSLYIETEQSMSQPVGKKKYALLSLDDEKKTFVPTKDQRETMVKGPGHGLWYVPDSVYLYEVVAQAGLSIFYKENNKFKIDELTSDDTPVF